jgi:hypothetical protein
MAKRQRVKATSTENIRPYRSIFDESMAGSINDFLSEMDPEIRMFTLIELGAEAMAAAAWMGEEEVKIEWVFEKCEKMTFRILKARAAYYQSKWAAAEAQKQASR